MFLNSVLFKVYLESFKYKKYIYYYKGIKVFLKKFGIEFNYVIYDLFLVVYLI